MREETSYIKHYVAYSLSYFVYGLIYTGIGPLIPYLSEKSHQPETSYSFVFTCRAIGMVLGTLACKIVQAKKMLTYHQAIAISSFGTFLMCFSFTYAEQFMIQGVSFLFNGFFIGVIETFVNTSIILLSSSTNLQKTFIIISGFFGIGGLFGPIFVYYF
jgi:fucose permease